MLAEAAPAAALRGVDKPPGRAQNPICIRRIKSESNSFFRSPVRLRGLHAVLPPALRAHVESALSEHLSSTLLLREKTAPLTVSTGLATLDALTGGLPRGALSEITGPASSGRTSVMLAALAAATRREEACALVDASDNFDPASAAAAGVDLDRLLWVRCSDDRSSLRKDQRRTALGRLEQVLKVTDLLLQGGGFGMVVLDLGDIPAESARRVPLTSWFRFRRAVEPTATVLLVVEREPCAKTCASLVVRLQRTAVCARDSDPAAETEFHGWKVLSRTQNRPFHLQTW